MALLKSRIVLRNAGFMLLHDHIETQIIVYKAVTTATGMFLFCLFLRFRCTRQSIFFMMSISGLIEEVSETVTSKRFVDRF